MRVGAFTSGKKGRVAAEKIKMSGYRSEGCNISKATLQDPPKKLVVSNAGSRRLVGKVRTYEDRAQDEGGEFLVCQRDAHLYPM
jgi:hypothetical protein